MKRKVRRCGVPGVLRLPLSFLWERLHEVSAKCRHFAKHGHKHCREYLENWLSATRRGADKEVKRRILEIITHEKTRADWQRQKHQMDKKQERSIRFVHTGDGAVREGKSEEKNTIFSGIHQQQIHVVEQAPICQSRLCKEFWCLADTPASAAVLAGICNFPKGMHQRTRGVIEEVATMHALISKNSVCTTISPTQYR